jgi:hypothetical protein
MFGAIMTISSLAASEPRVAQRQNVCIIGTETIHTNDRSGVPRRR